MNTIAIKQGTREWQLARAGRATASRADDVMARTRNGWGASRYNYRAELVVERITGMPYPSYVSTAMQWGIDHESEARFAYMFRTGVDDIVEVGFVQHPTIAMSGASPDGLIGGDGLVEIKCPNSSTHISTLLGENPPREYLHQVQWQMACTGRLWCDLISYDPRVPERMRLFIHHIRRDDAWIADMEDTMRGFLDEVQDMVDQLQLHYPAAELREGGGAAGQPQQPDATSPRQSDEPQAQAGGAQKRRWDELRLSAQAGILCGDSRFQSFMRDRGYSDCVDEKSTTERMRALLKVKSRADIEHGSIAELTLRAIVGDYRNWSKA